MANQPPPHVAASAAIVSQWLAEQEREARANGPAQITLPQLSAMDRFKAMGARPDKPVKMPDPVTPEYVPPPRYGIRRL
jgi:hypothetical protein